MFGTPAVEVPGGRASPGPNNDTGEAVTKIEEWVDAGQRRGLTGV